MSPEPVQKRAESAAASPESTVLPHADVAESTRAEKELRETEKRLDAILAHSPNPTFLKDLEGRYLYVNQEFIRVLHLSQEQIRGKMDDEVFPQEQAASFQANDLRVLQAGLPMEFEEVALHDDGPHTSIVHKFPLLDGEGKVYAIGGIATDITERKQAQEALRQSEERFRLLIEGVQDYAIFMLDPEGRVITWNAGAERIKGFKAEEILGQYFFRFFEVGDIECGKPQQELEMAATAGHFEDEGWRLRKDGSRFWANVLITSIRDRSGKLLGFSEVARDLTERKRFEQELKNERDQLLLVLDLNKRFASTLDLAQLFLALSAGLRSIVRSDATVLWLPESEKDKIRVDAIDFPEGKGFFNEGLVCPMSGSIPGRVSRTSKPFLFSSVPTWVNPKMHDVLTNEGLESGCALPLILGASVIGILHLACFRENAFTEHDVQLLGQLCDHVAIAVANALQQRIISESTQRLEEERFYLEEDICRERDFGEIVGKSQALKNTLKQVRKVAATDSTVLILGETGTGKELIARAIHNISSRRDRMFVSVNCSSIPASLLESELFGHEMGAFTGAITREIGRVELANKGTLFLDEIGDIPLELQSKFLRVLQEREFERLGSTRAIRADFRLVAATHRDLGQMVETGAFRSDLYYRLNIFPVEIPPLRERQEDIPLLVWHFARKYGQRMNKKMEMIRAEDMETLTHYSWPGNIRELQNIIERSVILTEGSILYRPAVAEPKLVGRNVPPLARTLAEAEREHIFRTLRDTEWVIGGPEGAAIRLGVRRTTLLYKMRRLGIFRARDSRAKP